MPSRLTSDRLYRQQDAASQLAARQPMRRRPEPGRLMLESLGLRERRGVARAVRRGPRRDPAPESEALAPAFDDEGPE
ncbi:MAG: hypothetical protein ACXW05_07035, partial [Gemmatirosa sp.]